MIHPYAAKKFKQSIELLIGAIITLITLGTITFSLLEGWRLIDSFYFVTMTATTVGYGDLTPTHTLSKIITILYAILIIPFVLYGFTIIAKYEIESVYRKVYGIQRKQLEQELEIAKTERQISAQKHLIKKQQEILNRQARELKKTEKELKKQEGELETVEDIVEEKIM